MVRNLFGTDGVRGRANTPPMTAEVALALGMAAGKLFTRGDHRHTVVIGKDTRLSGYMLEPALTAGFVAVGMDVVLLGPLPTPAVAMLTRSLRADLGVMVSASHNPFEDNGIKLFGPDGFKLSDALEAGIEQLMAAGPETLRTDAAALGRARRLNGAGERYIEAVKASFPRQLRLAGLKIALDCAHGAAYRVAPQVLWELGADIVSIGVEPDGFNINHGCGSTDTRLLVETVRDEGCDLGIALDGDADRLILIDAHGREIDGDQVLALIAARWRSAGRLRGDAVVATVMSNLGLEQFLAGEGVTLRRTRVGDRYVVETMREMDANLGGEQSGHVVMTDFATTGDGLLAALQVMAAMVEQDRPLAEVAHCFEPVPQALRNVRLNGGNPLATPAVREHIATAERSLAGRGRVLVRPSGTEPVVRVMVEADDTGLRDRILDEVCDVIASAA